MPKAAPKKPVREDKPPFSMKMIDLEAYKENRLELPPEGWEWMGISEHDFKVHQAKMIEREKAVPLVGTKAPDFEIERLFVIDAAGIVAYRSEMGPFGFTPEDWRDAIAAHVSPG